MCVENRIKEKFTELYGGSPDAVCFAPGRVNLIGEHTDYNGGHVFPCALDLGIYCAARLRDDRRLLLYSDNFPDVGVVEASVDALDGDGRWSDYVKAVLNSFISYGYLLDRGMELAYCGNLPDGAGLSSSAAMEVLTGVVLRELCGFAVTPQELALIGQFAENRFIGLNCGIMDQFASAMGRADHAIRLDTDTLRYAYAPIPHDRAAVVIVNSGVKHSLASSAYNDRRRECETALAQLNTAVKARALCDLTPEEFERCQTAITDPIALRRARHVISENARTVKAVQALCDGDLDAFGRMMVQSHCSLRDDYEVSCAELDRLVDAALALDGVYGARMTGGGFGGCTVNLVRRDAVDSFVSAMKAFYLATFRREAPIYVIGIGDGARKL